MTLIARYPDGQIARRGDILVDPTSPDSVDFLSAASKGTPSRPATIWARGVEVVEVTAARYGLTVEEVAP